MQRREASEMEMTSPTDENGVLFFTRQLEEILSLPAFLKFNTENKKDILASFSTIKFSVLSYTESAQYSDLEIFINKLEIQNPILKSAINDPKIKPHLLNLLLYSKYLFDYQKDIKKYAFYTEKFKTSLKSLQEVIPNHAIESYLQIFAEAKESEKFFKIIALAYHDIISHDMTLSDFRSGELMGHEIAYKVAKAPGKFQKLIVKDNDGNKLESYTIKEIEVVNEGIRNDALMASILIPDYIDKVPDVPVLYINWTGTYNKNTLLADKEIAPGEESYRRNEDQILKQMIAAIEMLYARYQKPIKIVYSGHSLGGSLAQLAYHSCQRMLAQNSSDEKIKSHAKQLEETFSSELDKAATTFKLSLHQRSLEGLALPNHMVCHLQIDTWNASGVVKAVENHTNKLCLLLTQTKNIEHTGNFGQVGGDSVQTSGQGAILSDVANNGAKINVLKIEPDTTRKLSTTVAPLGGGFAGAVIGPAIGLSTMTGGVGLAFLVFVAAMKTKLDAHTMKHFKESDRPQLAYTIYTSHHPDGSLNENPETGYKKVQGTLCHKSTLVDAFMNTVSNYGSSFGLRLQSDRDYQQKRFDMALSEAEKDDSEHAKVLAVLAAEIKVVGSDTRIIKELINRNLINVQDKMGKTVLQHAIENNNFSLAEKLISIENIDINLLDKDNNSPLLLFMLKANTAFGLNDEAYQFGKQLLARTADLKLENNQGQSASKIFNTWSWSGVKTSAREFSDLFSKKLSGEQLITKKNVM